MTETERLRGIVAQTWLERHSAELRASRRYARLARELEELDAPRELVAGVSQASRDEARHAELCFSVAATYGADEHLRGVAESEPRDVVTTSSHEAVVRELVSFCCISETLNASLLVETLEHATEPSICETVHTLLSDEVRHGRLGFTSLGWSRDLGRTDELSPALVSMLEALRVADLFEHDDVIPWSEALVQHGELSVSMRREIFWRAMSGVVLRGFDAFGLDTSSTRVWLARFDARFASATSSEGRAASREPQE